MQLVVLGLNHRTAPLELREQVAFLEDDARAALADLAARSCFGETALLSTCNRTELYAATENPEAVERDWRALVRERRGVDVADVTYRHERRECVEHLFRVASGVDSMVLGETGILGQVRAAHELAVGQETLGPLLGRLFPAALRVGKRSRTETAVGRGAASLAKAGVALARKIFGDLSKRRGLVVGSGETGAQTASHLSDEGMTQLTFANRTVSRAEELVARHGGAAIGLDGVPAALADADMLVTAVGATQPILTHEIAAKAREKRKRGQTLLIIDLGVPRNVEPVVSEIEEVFLYAVDDLESLVTMSRERREQEIPKVERIVTEEADRFDQWLVSLGATPVLIAMREHAEAVRQQSLEKFTKTLSKAERKQLEAFSKALVNKLLHEPTISLRSCDASTQDGILKLAWTRRLFGLDDESRDGDR